MATVWPQYTRPKIGGCVPFGGGALGPNVMWPAPGLTFVPSGILIHPAVWPQHTWAENWGDGCAPWGIELGPHLTQCVQGRDLPACQV